MLKIHRKIIEAHKARRKKGYPEALDAAGTWEGDFLKIDPRQYAMIGAQHVDNSLPKM